MVLGDTAIANYRFVVTVKAPSLDLRRRYRTTNVWVKRDGRWQIVAAHMAFVLDPQQAALLWGNRNSASLLTACVWRLKPRVPGTLGHCRLLEPIGSGGMGVVYYRARDERLERDVAIEVLRHGRVLDEETARRRLRTEALALSRLNHPNIATIHDFDSAAGIDFLVMEYIPGASLDERVRRGELFRAPRFVTLVCGFARGLRAARRSWRYSWGSQTGQSSTDSARAA